MFWLLGGSTACSQWHTHPGVEAVTSHSSDGATQGHFAAFLFFLSCIQIHTQNEKHAVVHSRFVKGFCWKTSTFKIRTSVAGETLATREEDDNGSPVPTDPDSRLHFITCSW